MLLIYIVSKSNKISAKNSFYLNVNGLLKKETEKLTITCMMPGWVQLSDSKPERYFYFELLKDWIDLLQMKPSHFGKGQTIMLDAKFIMVILLSYKGANEITNSKYNN
jgi:hypothetical protein